MSDQVQILVAFILYVALFAWLGARRGARRELVVLIVSVGGYFGLQRFQRIVVNLVNLGRRFLAFVQAGGLSNGDGDSLTILREGPVLIRPGEEQTFLFLVWAALLLATYVVSEKSIKNSAGQSKLVSALVGVANGLFYITVVLPRLVALLAPGGEIPEEMAVRSNAQTILGVSLGILMQSLGNLWEAVEPYQAVAALLVLSALVVAAASTLSSKKA